MAQKDNDKVPECHYRKALHYGSSSKFIESYEAGLAAEKEQLPCFLPNNFKAKGILEKRYSFEKAKNVGSSSKEGNGPAPTSFNRLFEKVKIDPKRKLLILKNREMFNNIVAASASQMYFADLTVANLPNTPNPPSTKNLKKIMIKDMDPTKDKVYNGFVLEERLLDWAFQMTGVFNVLEDENGDLQRVGFYNKNLNLLNAIKTFQPNFKISIINPYMRMAMDGSNAIRIEGPEFIKIDKTFANQKCHCCGKEAKLLSYSECMMAKYCSKECQTFDWTELNHKGICKNLKRLAKLI